MILERKAPAKVNLGLHVLRKRSDGYHDIETVLMRTGWADRLTIRPAPAFRFTCSDPELPVGEENLCVRAVRSLEVRYGISVQAALHLDKTLPFGAGLGGGSSDAAATLQLVSELMNLDLESALLHELASDLGSDIPFFLGDSAALGTGRGNELTPLVREDAPYHFPFGLLLVVPPVHVSTGEAYQYVKPDAANRPDLPALVGANDLQLWREELVNDFEPSVFSSFPIVGDIKTAMYAQGAGYAAMSGSGSAVFGVFDEISKAENARGYFQNLQCKVWLDP